MKRKDQERELAPIAHKAIRVPPADVKRSSPPIAQIAPALHSLLRSDELARRTEQLSVSHPGEPEELEANHQAERVVREEPDASTASATALAISPSAAPGAITSPPQGELFQGLDAGNQLEPSTRKSMESSFGRDFSGVRIHTGSTAATSAKKLDARAFTAGQHIVFGEGECPGTGQAGKKLLAHELTHVTQNQKSSDASVRESSSPTRIRRESLVGQASSYLSGKKEAAGKWVDTKKWEAYRALIAGLKSSKNTAVGYLRSLVPKLPQTLQGTAATLIDVFDFVEDMINALLLAIIGLAVGFVSGIVDLVLGILKLALGLIKMIVDLLVAILGQPEEFNQDLDDLAAAIKGIPPGLKKVFDDWLERYKHANTEEQVLMGGELVGQIEAFIATFALAGTKAGQAGSISMRVGNTGTRVLEAAGVGALKEAPAIVTVVIPAVVPKTAAEAAVISSQMMMMSTPGSLGGAGGGGGSSSGKGSKRPKSEGSSPESDQSTKTAATADSEEARLQQKYGGRSKTVTYPPNEWKYIEQLENRYPKLKSARLRPISRPAVADEAIFEERMQTGQGRFSLAAYNEKGEQIIQFDGLSPQGFVEEIKIEQSMEKTDEIMSQLRRQADFARDYGLKGVEYSIDPPSVAEEVERRVIAEHLRNVYRAHGQ